MAAAYAWARPSIVSVSRVHGHTPLLGILPSGRWRFWFLSVGNRIEVDGSRCRHRLWSAAAPDASSRRGFGSSRVVTFRASHVNSAGSIDSPLMRSMADKIKEHLNAEFVDVKDAYGDGRHVSIDVVASSFEGQSAVTRQRMVYKAIWEELQSTVHAVDQMTTRTPGEARTATDEGTARTDKF